MEEASTPSAPQGLARLPNELLDNIFSHLDTPELHALSLTCRNATAAANNVMYMGYANHTYGPNGILTVGKHLYPFLRTLCERPDLAAKVKSMVMMGWETEFDMARKHKQFPWLGYGTPLRDLTNSVVCSNDEPRTDLQLFLNAAMTSKLIPRQDWGYAIQPPRALKDLLEADPTEMNTDEDLVRNLHNQVEDAFMVLILALLPNLERLEVRRLSRCPILDWHHFLSKSSTSLRSLKRLKIHGMEGMRMHLQFLDLLPKICQLELNFLQVEGHDFTHGRLPTTQLTKLMLQNTACPPEFFHKLTEGQHLTKILYQTQDNEDVSPQIPEIPPSSNYSLTRLTLNIAKTKRSFRVLETFSLLQFTNLQSLVISYDALFQPLRRGDDVSRFEYVLRQRVPPTVKLLCIHRVAHYDWTRALEQLAVVRKSWASSEPMKLRVHLIKGRMLSESVEEGFRAAFAGTNVIVRILSKD
jgi:hypothetical protein